MFDRKIFFKIYTNSALFVTTRVVTTKYFSTKAIDNTVLIFNCFIEVGLG